MKSVYPTLRISSVVSPLSVTIITDSSMTTKLQQQPSRSDCLAFSVLIDDSGARPLDVDVVVVIHYITLHTRLGYIKSTR